MKKILILGRKLMIRGMNMDFSWKRSAVESARLYEKAIQDRKNILEQGSLTKSERPGRSDMWGRL